MSAIEAWAESTSAPPPHMADSFTLKGSALRTSTEAERWERFSSPLTTQSFASDCLAELRGTIIDLLRAATVLELNTADLPYALAL